MAIEQEKYLKDKMFGLLDLERFQVNSTGEIDKVIITINVTLLAAMVVILNMQTLLNKYIKVSIIFTLITLTACLFLTLWHKVRFPKRMKMFRDKTKDILEHYVKGFQDYLNNYYKPMIFKTFKDMVEKDVEEQAKIDIIKNGKVEPKALDAYIEIALNNAKSHLKENLPDHSFITHNIAEGLSSHIDSSNKYYLASPLPERLSKFKFIMDILAHKTRFIFFTVGILAFALSIILFVLK